MQKDPVGGYPLAGSFAIEETAMKQYVYLRDYEGHKAGDVVEVSGWDAWYLVRKEIIRPRHNEEALVLETPEGKPRRKKR